MKVTETPIEGVLVIEPQVFGDERGFFSERFNAERYRDLGLDVSFVQDNLSKSRAGTLRGLHFQKEYPQGKLVEVLNGVVYDVVVDLRPLSPTFREWHGIELSEPNRLQVWVPPGLAHGFCVLSERADFYYKCTEYYHPEDEGGIVWNDPDLAIDWPIQNPLLSEKDASLPELAELSIRDLPQVGVELIS